ncbi:ABC transporter DrrB family efflux protein [Marisediminicola sp. UYEF4]|uniref:ABC transporter permease n=1 Tax=Marisediminicola sp. UYEF4 TaxID=1756384 RepID=UPI00339290F9
MSPRLTAATAARVLTQIAHDRRTIVLLLAVPSLLIGLLAWLYSDTDVFARVGPSVLGLFPFIIMFLITSITTLRERRSGTLERLMTMPLGRFDFIAGYTIAFGLMAVAQSLVAVGFAVWVCGLEVAGAPWLLVLVAVANAILGSTLGLLASAFANTEFQVVQFMPALVFPQVLLGGIFLARDQMPDALEAISDWLPLSHSIDALILVSTEADASSDVLRELAVVTGFIVAAVALGSLTLRRQTR